MIQHEDYSITDPILINNQHIEDLFDEQLPNIPLYSISLPKKGMLSPINFKDI